MLSRRRVVTFFILSVGTTLPVYHLLAGDPAQGHSPRRNTAVAATPQVIGLAASVVGTLMVAPGLVTFQGTNPSTTPVVAGSSPVQADITITGPRPTHTWTLTVAAQGPTLNSGAATIPVSAMTWTSTGQVLAGTGTVNAVAGPQTLSTANNLVASGSEGGRDPFQARVTVSFSFTDSWSYSVDTYSQTVLFTLTAP